MRHMESKQQCNLIRWARMRAATEPRLELLYAIPNGGARSKIEAGIMKGEGVTPGIPDLHLACPVAPWHGMYIEMKFGKGQLTPAQREMQARLEMAGYYVVTCWTWAHAAVEIEKYLQIESTMSWQS